MMDFRKDHLEIDNARVKQLCVIGVAAERFWDLAFHQRRGLSSCAWSDVTSVNLWDVTRKTLTGNFKRIGSCEVELTPADSQLALAVAKAALRVVVVCLFSQMCSPSSHAPVLHSERKMN